MIFFVPHRNLRLSPFLRSRKEETPVEVVLRGFSVPRAGVEVRSTSANATYRRPLGREINKIMFAQPQIKVSTAAEVMN